MLTAMTTPFVHTEELPPYRGILAVDAQGYTDLPGRLHQSVSGLIPQLVERAFARAGLAEAWNEPAFFGHTGDGFALGVPTRLLPFLVHPFLPELQSVLAEHHHAARTGEPRPRLRVSLNVGPVSATGGNGTERNNTHRLLDSSQVKAMLSGTSPDVTFVAAILSDRLFHDVVEGGYAGVHKDRFLPVSATVQGKRFEQRAWLFVPTPSGGLGAVPGLQPPPDPAPVAEAAPAGTVVNAPGNHTGNVGPNHGTISIGERR